ncbi:Holliday junction resolvase RuvX [Mycoplasmopsis hyopharyngis]|uniref:Holliday junction resolvase RuvX n=1 Tax=Mycoplasmopsis hyopharyngis TaxID=29558 RepID=UPI003873A7BE
MRKLALDIGTASCGFAISDESNIISIGLENYKFPENEFDYMFKRIGHYLQEYQVDKIVIGLPLRSNGTFSERTTLIQDLGHKIKQQFNVDIYFENEYGSTKKAEEILMLTGMKRKKRKQFKDKLAAQIILDEYLKYHL